uniref:UBC core domain-containing protein n=1 Tax=Anguilla anguilla TaxID=7936 RepID=A0A0E9SDI7_ANGAN
MITATAGACSSSRALYPTGFFRSSNRPRSGQERAKGGEMSSDRQRSDDESPSTSSGSSDADQRDLPVPEPEEQEERKQPTPSLQKKDTKLSSKTTAKLSTSAKSAGPKGDNIYEWRSTILGPPGSVYEGGSFPGYNLFLRLTPSNHQR